MKTVVVLSTFLAIAIAQRPGYLVGTMGQPELAYRFRQNMTTISPLGNRLGFDGSGTTQRIPVDARGDHDLVDRLNTWPKENRPYWLVNAEAIERFRNQGANSVQQQGQQGQLGQQGQFGQQRQFGQQGQFRQQNQPGQQQQQRQGTILQSRFSDSAYDRNSQSGFDPNLQYDDFGNPIYRRK